MERKVFASNKAERWGGKVSSGGGALRGARLRPQLEPPGLERPSLGEAGTLKNPHRILPGRKGAQQGTRAAPREGQGLPQAPGATNRGGAPGESPRTRQAGLGQGLERARRGPGGKPVGQAAALDQGLRPAACGSCAPGTGTGTRGQQHRPRIPGPERTQPRILRSPWGKAEVGRAQDSEDSPAAGCPQAVQDSTDWETAVGTVRS